MTIPLFDEISSEEEEYIIKKTALFINKYGMELPAFLFIGTIKPLVYLGGQLGRFFLGPLLPFMGRREDAFIQTFEKQENVERLLKMLEEFKKEEKQPKVETPEEPKKSLWKRLSPF